MGSHQSIWSISALLGFSAVCLAQAAGVATRTYDFPYQHGDTVIVQNDYGRVRVQAWDAAKIQAEVKRIASDDAQLANVAVVAQKSRDKIFLSAYFYHYRAESVYIQLNVPRSSNVVIWGANPAVELADLEGYVRAYTQTGLITATDVVSSTSLTTERGDILLVARRQPVRDIRLESVSGEVRCEVSSELNLRGWMRAGGRLSWNGEVELRDGHLEKQVGVGGPLLLASSIEGNVTVDLNQSNAPWAGGNRVPDAASEPRQGGAAPTRDENLGSIDEPYEPDYPQRDRPGAQQAPAPTPSSPQTQSDSTVEDYRTRPDGSIDSGYSLKVDVNWTYLNVSVRDRYTNRSVPNLRSEDFLVYEDGASQQIERFESNEAPFNLLLLLDVSGSTKSFIGLIKQASIEFTREIKSNDAIGVAVFNSNVRLIQPFTNDRARVERSINRVRSGGGTAFYDALDTSIHDYMADLEGRKAIVVFTDGVDNQLTGDWSSGSRTTFRTLYRSIQEIDTIIYTIFLDTEGGNSRSRRGRSRRGGSVIDVLGDIMRGGNTGGGPMNDQEAYEEARRELRIIADQTGGRMYSPTDIYDLNNVYSEIADDLRVQYTLGYASTNAVNDGRWRSIEVRIRNNPDFAVRARKGYYAPGGPGDRHRQP